VLDIFIKLMNSDRYKSDRDHVSAMSFEEADDHISYWLDKTEDERLNAACFLINQLYNVTPETKIDRTITDHRKFSDG
jgi:hypothetical protein